LRHRALEDDVCWYLKQNAFDKIKSEASEVLISGHVDIGRKPFNTSVADIRTIKEGDEVEESESGKEVEVKLPKKASLVYICGGFLSRKRGECEDPVSLSLVCLSVPRLVIFFDVSCFSACWMAIADDLAKEQRGSGIAVGCPGIRRWAKDNDGTISKMATC
jgi:hypothetical protein